MSVDRAVVSLDALRAVAQAWLHAGRRVIGPVEVRPGMVYLAPIVDPSQLVLSGWVHPRNTVKEFVFPRHERLYGYRRSGPRVEVIDEPPPQSPQLILGVRPCDAAALPTLDPLFNWDYADAFYNARRAATTIVSLACVESDAHCFCTSVGLGPASERGADALLVPADDGAFEVRLLTDKGRAALGEHLRPAAEGAQPSAFAGPPRRVALERLRPWLAEHFEDPAWADATRRCVGCGACAYYCPTCHCFDIVDEGRSSRGGRYRNWDSCQFALFTLHASGHNPRATQAQRQRQRILHKFWIYPEKFGDTLCTGCGQCGRVCPAGLGVLRVLEQLPPESGCHG